MASFLREEDLPESQCSSGRLQMTSNTTQPHGLLSTSSAPGTVPGEGTTAGCADSRSWKASRPRLQAVCIIYKQMKVLADLPEALSMDWELAS